MSKRAKEAAMEAYPVVLDNVTVGFNFSVEEDVNSYPRGLFQEGYESAEKDLGWHSVEESLPDKDEMVVFHTKGGWETGRYDGKYWVSRDYSYSSVDYWMSLLKLPEE